jgi:uncharacterized protein with ParB-like and HNH nuclease domain
MSLSQVINGGDNWFEDYADDAEGSQINEYDISATPNDFNVLTLFNFIETGFVRIPGFQRNYVWDLARASKLIESLILGLPVPQIFLYQESKNRFQVIDGQQRLMSIYYFIKKRFPNKDKRVELRAIFDKNGKIPDDVLFSDIFFSDFKLKLPERLPGQPNTFNGLNYATLGEYKTSFELRPIRNVVVKQNVPDDDDSSIYEIFNRLNSGGVNLRPQEIRMSLYHSDFYELLYQLNALEGWRVLLNSKELDLHVKDVEIILRGFAMLIDGDSYTPSLVKFLNKFSRKCKTQTSEQNDYLGNLFRSFLDGAKELPSDAFMNKKNSRFNMALFEAVFTATCKKPFADRQMVTSPISIEKIRSLENNVAFIDASIEGTTSTKNVAARLKIAIDIFS